MADAPKKDEPKAAAGPTPTDGPEAKAAAGPKNKKMMMMIIGAVVVLLGGGGAAFFMMSGGGGGHGEKAAEHGEGHGETPPAAEHGEKKAEGHGEKKAEEHGEKKEAAKGGEHGEKPAEGHGGGHGEKAEEPKKEAPAAATADIGFGETYKFKPFNMNLGNPLENHYARFELSLEYGGGEEQKAEIEKRLDQLRDAIISVTSRKSKEFLLGPDGKDQLKREILIRINRYMSKPVTAVYIPELLIE